MLFLIYESRTILPLVLAQLLIQFQKPIIIENPSQNATNQMSNGTFNDYANGTVYPNDTSMENTTMIDRITRNVRSVADNEITKDQEITPIQQNLVPTDYPENGMPNKINSIFQFFNTQFYRSHFGR